MKKVAVFLLAAVCVFTLTACDGNKKLSDMPSVQEDSVQNMDTIDLNGEKILTEQDIISMYHHVAEEGWEYIDCVVIPDFASERVGAALFRDNNIGTSSVLFFDSDGHFQQAGIYAELTSEPSFTYLGEGAVTFKLKSDDGKAYDYTLTLSVNEGSVYFKGEDNLLE